MLSRIFVIGAVMTAWLLVVAGAGSCLAGEAAVEYHSAASSAERQLPFSDAVRVGDLVFLSGKIGVDPETLELVPGGIQAETRQIMENLSSSLERVGLSMENVVKCTVFIADISEWAALNEIYVQYFPPDRLPARSALGANGLALGARAEIECIAATKR